jgi:hypothetical protein
MLYLEVCYFNFDKSYFIDIILPYCVIRINDKSFTNEIKIQYSELQIENTEINKTTEGSLILMLRLNSLYEIESIKGKVLSLNSNYSERYGAILTVFFNNNIDKY